MGEVKMEVIRLNISDLCTYPLSLRLNWCKKIVSSHGLWSHLSTGGEQPELFKKQQKQKDS